MNVFQSSTKRLIDITFSLIGIIIFLIPCLVISILIKLDSKGPIFFLQKRTGKKQKVFNIIKFRTMRVNTPSMSGLELKEDNPNITRVGKILRKYSIDEIPQLINVLKGEMSIVGPRPDREVPAQPYTNEEMIRFRFKPGITGLAQINGRNSLNFTDRRKFDIKYVKEYSLLLDLRIILKTIKVQLSQEDVYNNDEDRTVK